MVLAGPGSGKTSVIVERTAYMINEGKIPASSILVVTFSRAAATEMKERFLKFVGQNRSEVTFGTLGTTPFSDMIVVLNAIDGGYIQPNIDSRIPVD